MFARRAEARCYMRHPDVPLPILFYLKWKRKKKCNREMHTAAAASFSAPVGLFASPKRVLFAQLIFIDNWRHRWQCKLMDAHHMMLTLTRIYLGSHREGTLVSLCNLYLWCWGKRRMIINRFRAISLLVETGRWVVAMQSVTWLYNSHPIDDDGKKS